MEGDVAGARFYTGRPESWCIKYSVTPSVKPPPCQSTTLPKHKNMLLKRALYSRSKITPCLDDRYKYTRRREGKTAKR
jgi:hypothetical protein